jgi:hypothetical protein
MKNLTSVREEKLEVMPKRVTFNPRDSECGYRGYDFPSVRVERFFFSRVGKPWSVVFSEFKKCKWIKAEYRTLSQLRYLVMTNTFLENNKIYYNFDKGWGFHGDVKFCIEDEDKNLLYVHPVTKLLCCRRREKGKKRRKLERQGKITWWILGDYHQLLKINGIWYEAWAKPMDYGRDYIGPRDPLLDDTLMTPKQKQNTWLYYYKLRPRIYKRQLNHKELKRFGLTNDKIVHKIQEC